MSSRPTTVVALICAALLGSCTARSSHAHEYGPTPTAEAAISAAHQELADTPDAKEPFTAERRDGAWLVRSASVGRDLNVSYYVVTIDAATGKAVTGSYLSATIHEKF